MDYGVNKQTRIVLVGFLVATGVFGAIMFFIPDSWSQTSMYLVQVTSAVYLCFFGIFGLVRKGRAGNNLMKIHTEDLRWNSPTMVSLFFLAANFLVEFNDVTSILVVLGLIGAVICLTIVVSHYFAIRQIDRVDVTEKGFLFPYQLLEWNQVVSYEWKTPYLLSIKTTQNTPFGTIQRNNSLSITKHDQMEGLLERFLPNLKSNSVDWES